MWQRQRACGHGSSASCAPRAMHVCVGLSKACRSRTLEAVYLESCIMTACALGALYCSVACDRDSMTLHVRIHRGPEPVRCDCARVLDRLTTGAERVPDCAKLGSRLSDVGVFSQSLAVVWGGAGCSENYARTGGGGCATRQRHPWHSWRWPHRSCLLSRLISQVSSLILSYNSHSRQAAWSIVRSAALINTDTVAAPRP